MITGCNAILWHFFLTMDSEGMWFSLSSWRLETLAINAIYAVFFSFGSSIAFEERQINRLVSVQGTFNEQLGHRYYLKTQLRPLPVKSLNRGTASRRDYGLIWLIYPA